MVEFLVTDHGTAKIVADKMYASAEKVETTNIVFEKILLDMLRITRIQIDSEGRRGGGSYAQLREDTKLKKGRTEILKTEGAREKYSAFSQMGRFDTLFNSVTRKDAQFQIMNANKNSLRFGTRRPYAAVHQHGGGKGGRVPARPFLRVIPSDQERWNYWLTRHLVSPFMTSEL
jgi:phage gpG-like protein